MAKKTKKAAPPADPSKDLNPPGGFDGGGPQTYDGRRNYASGFYLQKFAADDLDGDGALVGWSSRVVRNNPKKSK